MLRNVPLSGMKAQATALKKGTETAVTESSKADRCPARLPTDARPSPGHGVTTCTPDQVFCDLPHTFFANRGIIISLNNTAGRRRRLQAPAGRRSRP